MFICDDCRLETDEMNVGPIYLSLPDPVCQDCGNDLFNGNYGSKTFAQLLSEKTEEQEFLEEIFGKKDQRYMRTGSSHANINYMKERAKKLAKPLIR